ncbi:MAG TPA: MarR family transcriptional regulator [Actinophytocola sp.]|uniref:MarR family transcriptional regulator n=1 Tax=Actinophytocola sp. TaxID=1872138 RepID=UPI002DB990CA|nr:MarR family transcriptional regulator [Actinophytocola sp.]HEU5475106.1 MarR family transcriptional regulator [Actinophytocola sp.]
MAQLAGSSRLLRTLNERAALGLLLDCGPLTRGELGELTGLAKPTTSEVLRRLREAGLVEVIGRRTGGPGPNAEVYAVNPDAGHAAAVSLGAGGGTAAVCDLTGAIRARRRIAARPADPVQAIADAVQGACRAAHVPVRRLDHVQLGWSGPDPTGALGARLRTTVRVAGEAHLAAVAERGTGADDFALLWLGEDSLGLAVGHTGGPPHGTRDIGALPVPGENGAVRAFRDLAGGAAVRELARRHGITAAAGRDAVAAAAGPFLDALAERVALGLAAIVAVLDPPRVVLAGEIGQAAGAPLAAAVTAALRQLSIPRTPVVTTAVPGDAVLLGAIDTALATVRAGLLDRMGGQP